MICALQTARKGSKGVPNKTFLDVDGKPLYIYNRTYAIRCKSIDRVFFSSDFNDNMLDICEEDIIHRPANLSTDETSHYAAILHGLIEIEERIGEKVDYLVILLGNNCGAFTEDLTEGIVSASLPYYDSAMSVGRYNMFNPNRAFKLEDSGLQSVLDNDNPKCNERDAFGDIQFFNGSFWICSRKSIIECNGRGPFPWLGNRIAPIYQDSSIMELDEPWQIPIIKRTPIEK
jgi:CMP-N,N'-diacetyllegionaminic acid synthase